MMIRFVVGCLVIFSHFPLAAEEVEEGEVNILEGMRNIVHCHSTLEPEDQEAYLNEFNFSKRQLHLFEQVTALDWKTEGEWPLSSSKSMLKVPEGYIFVLGEDAKKYTTINNEPFDDNLEAYVVDNSFTHSILLEFANAGFVTLDDWKHLDSEALLKAIRENTENANIERKKLGQVEIHVLGWVQKPTLDPVTKIVYWAIEADVGEPETSINAVALRLGREGFERVVWITNPSSFTTSGGSLETILQAHSFEKGFRYEDHQKGDRLAEFGIAALVTSSLGIKMLKAGSLFFTLKKFGAFIIAGVVTGFFKLKKFLKKES